MNRTVFILSFFVIFSFSGTFGTSNCKPDDRIKAKGVQEGLKKQRGEQILDANDALIQRTVRAYGGDYYRREKSKILIFNQRAYKNFSIRVIESEHIILETPDGTYRLRVVGE